MIMKFFFQALITALVVLLVLALLPGCVKLEAPPLGFVMFCDACGQVTGWGIAEEYLYCQESGTVWKPQED